MEIGLFDEVKEVRLIPDAQQIEEIEFWEAQEEFCSAACRWHDTKQPDAMEKVTEAEVRLLNAFFAGDSNRRCVGHGRLTDGVCSSSTDATVRVLSSVCPVESRCT